MQLKYDFLSIQHLLNTSNEDYNTVAEEPAKDVMLF